MWLRIKIWGEKIRKDKDAKVVFKSMNFEIACDKADELNEES